MVQKILSISWTFSIKIVKIVECAYINNVFIEELREYEAS